MNTVTTEQITAPANGSATPLRPEFGRWEDVPENGRRPIAAALSITRLRQIGRAVGPEFTTAPVQEGALPCGLPEFTRIKTTSYYTGLSRGKLYEGINEGWVRSVSLR